jgi:hypothetical protein
MIQFCSLIARNKVGLAVDYSDNCRFLQQLTGEKPPPAAPVYLAPPPRQTANSNKPSFLAKLGFSLPLKIFASAPAALPDRASPACLDQFPINPPAVLLYYLALSITAADMRGRDRLVLFC